MKNKQYHLQLSNKEYEVLLQNNLLNNKDLNHLFLIGTSKMKNQEIYQNQDALSEMKTHNMNLEKIIHDIFDII